MPEPSARPLAAEKVDASGEAYALLHTPDAALGIASAGLSLMLIGMGGRHRHAERPWIPLGLATKTLGDAAGSVWLFSEQVSKHRRVCSWCTLAAVLNVAALSAALPEAVAALPHARHCVR